jgi:inosine/xanthosine triphosphatase
MKILVGSTNPVKVQAVKEAFSRFFKGVEVVGRKVDSGVPDQPFGDDTFRGARNRAYALMKDRADFYVGLEGGVMDVLDRTFTFGALNNDP